MAGCYPPGVAHRPGPHHGVAAGVDPPNRASGRTRCWPAPSRPSSRSSPLGFTSARRRRVVWLCAQGAWLCARRVRSAVQLCAEGGRPAVGSRRSGARRYWPGCPGPALAALLARWRRGPPAHGSGGFAPYGLPRPARPAPAPPYRQSPSPAAAPPTRCCQPRCQPAAPPRHLVLTLTCCLPALKRPRHTTRVPRDEAFGITPGGVTWFPGGRRVSIDAPRAGVAGRISGIRRRPDHRR